MRNVLNNAKVMAETLIHEGLTLVSGGTDNHLILVDLRNVGLTGKDAQIMLDEAGITANKNSIPHDTAGPLVTSGIRFGTPAMTTRGLGAGEMKEIAELIALAFKNPANTKVKQHISGCVREITSRFPLYEAGTSFTS